jgi:putative ABC transport system permease protein
MFLDALQVSFKRGELVDRIDVVVAEGEDVRTVQERIQAKVKGSAQVEPPTGRAARLVSALWAFRNALNVSGVAALWVGMFLIYNAVSVSVAQRRREVGILRALGVTRRGVTLLFCLEALIMAVVGSIFGLLFGSELAKAALASASSQLDGFDLAMTPPPPRITLDIAAMAVVTALISTALAAYYPARRSAHIDPAEALRASRASALLARLPERKLAAIGAIVVALSTLPAYFGGELNGYLASTAMVVGLALWVPLCVRGLRRLFVGTAEGALGIPGRLALDNVERALGRSSITVVAVMLAIAMSMTIGTYGRAFERSLVEWADETFFGSAIVTAGSPANEKRHVPFGIEVMERLRGVEGLAEASPYRRASYDMKGRRFQINARDATFIIDELRRHGGRLRVIDGPRELDGRAMVEAPRVTLSENLAHALNLSAGDKVSIDTPTGARTLEIYAIVVDYSSDQGALFMDRKWYSEFFADDQIDCLELFYTEGADHDQVTARVRERLGDSDLLFITPQETLRQDLKKVGANLSALTQAPELVTLVVAFMGVVGTMLAAVIDRIREIGVLRAIGATRRQIVASIVVEAGFLGLAGTLLGVAAGVPEGFLFLKVIGTATSGWNLPYTFPYETALRVGTVIVSAAALAGLLPGMRAARLDVRDALSYD